MSAPWDGRPIELTGVATVSYLDLAAPKKPGRTPAAYTNNRSEPGEYRPSMVQPVTGIVFHTLRGTANGSIAPPSECGSDAYAWANASNMCKPDADAATHFIVPNKGPVIVLADLVRARPWGAGSWNPYTWQFECDQLANGSVCASMLALLVEAAWSACELSGVQPMLPFRPDGKPDLEDIPRLTGEGARTYRGGWYHANDDGRDPRDPGTAIPYALRDAGWEPFDVRNGQDRDVWKGRQRELGMTGADVDGIPGAATVQRMQQRLGRSTWIKRPNTSAQTATSVGAALLLAGVVAAILSRRKR